MFFFCVYFLGLNCKEKTFINGTDESLLALEIFSSPVQHRWFCLTSFLSFLNKKKRRRKKDANVPNSRTVLTLKRKKHKLVRKEKKTVKRRRRKKMVGKSQSERDWMVARAIQQKMEGDGGVW